MSHWNGFIKNMPIRITANLYRRNDPGHYGEITTESIGTLVVPAGTTGKYLTKVENRDSLVVVLSNGFNSSLGLVVPLAVVEQLFPAYRA